MPTYHLVIKAAEDHHRPDPRWAGTTAAERIVLRHWHMETNGLNVTLPRMVSNKAVAEAFVSYGRWSVKCPWCSSSQNASREDHRFFCVECGNVAVNGHWVPVVWPANWRRIEELLEHRPDAKVQNWFTWETVEDLAAENQEHGVI